MKNRTLKNSFASKIWLAKICPPCLCPPLLHPPTLIFFKKLANTPLDQIWTFSFRRFYSLRRPPLVKSAALKMLEEKCAEGCLQVECRCLIKVKASSHVCKLFCGREWCSVGGTAMVASIITFLIQTRNKHVTVSRIISKKKKRYQDVTVFSNYCNQFGKLGWYLPLHLLHLRLHLSLLSIPSLLSCLSLSLLFLFSSSLLLFSLLLCGVFCVVSLLWLSIVCARSGVWCVVWHAENLPCVGSSRLRVYIQNVSVCTGTSSTCRYCPFHVSELGE